MTENRAIMSFFTFTINFNSIELADNSHIPISVATTLTLSLSSVFYLSRLLTTYY